MDRSVVEVFDGVSAMSFFTFPSAMEQATGVQLVAGSSGVRAALEVHAMGSAINIP